MVDAMAVLGWVAIALAALVAGWIAFDLHRERRERVPSWARRPRKEKRPPLVYPSSLVGRDARLYGVTYLHSRHPH